MPHTRRRKFSIKKGIDSRKSTKNHKDQSSYTEPDEENIISKNSAKNDDNIIANSSKYSAILESVSKGDIVISSPGERQSEKMNTEVLIMSTIEKLATLHKVNDVLGNQSKEFDDMWLVDDIRTDLVHNRDKNSCRREVNPRQHRIKVRSPKRRAVTIDNNKLTDITNRFTKRQTIGTCAINWKQELTFYNSENVIRSETPEDEERASTHSLDDMCRICHGGDTLSLDLGRLISACACRGTVGRVHVKCLERWLTESGKSRCELCGTMYITRRVHRYGVPKALVMWILSHNVKQLMVDSLGIMLMSPLAVLAAWLSGRTLAGLMMQENRVTPWPLASTFVLACMTLVCYYCWIVSAATRHALGWWIWYRSQYEVRLQIQENED